MSIIVGFIIAALVLVFFEIILPGGVLGVLGALCVLAATWFGFDAYGVMGGVVVFFGTLSAMAVLVFVEFKLLAKTSLGQKFFLKSSIDGHTREAVAEDSVIGKEGIALTRLNPAGKVAVDGKNYEAHSQDGYIDCDQPIAVIAQDNFKLIIKKL
jgi:membrane-bound serine protease (ClpP class)